MSEFTRFAEGILRNNDTYSAQPGAEAAEVKQFESVCKKTGNCDLLTKSELETFLRALSIGRLGDYHLTERDKQFALRWHGRIRSGGNIHLTTIARDSSDKFLDMVMDKLKPEVEVVPSEPKTPPPQKPKTGEVAAKPKRRLVSLDDRRIEPGTRVKWTESWTETVGGRLRFFCEERTGVVVKEKPDRRCESYSVAVRLDAASKGDPYKCVSLFGMSVVDK